MDSLQVIQRDQGDSASHASTRSGARFTPVVRIGTLLVYLAAILYLGTAQPQSLPATELLGHDKLLHAVAFGGLGVLTYRCYTWYWPQVAVRWSIGLPIAASTLVGAILEIVQATLPYRSMEFADLVADFIGAALMVLWAKWFRLERPLLRYGL
ncbi:MAG TPA: VanZ family protein [Polyangiaceae bacterium]|nr:VanZ family protein [Polyangiaceae bacterium]